MKHKRYPNTKLQWSQNATCVHVNDTDDDDDVDDDYDVVDDDDDDEFWLMDECVTI